MDAFSVGFVSGFASLGVGIGALALGARMDPAPSKGSVAGDEVAKTALTSAGVLLVGGATCAAIFGLSVSPIWKDSFRQGFVNGAIPAVCGVVALGLAGVAAAVVIGELKDR